jgi:outer membrane protein
MSRALVLLIMSLALAWPAAAREQPAGTAPVNLTLEQALEIARSKNLTILAAREDIKRTRGILREGYASAYPHLDLAGSYTRTDKSSISSFTTPDGQSLTFGTDETYQYNVGLEQRLYSGGLIFGGIRAARNNTTRVLELVAVTVQDVELQVRRDFYEMMLAQELVAVAQESVTLFEENLKNVEAKFSAGQVAKFELTRARVALANRKPPLIAAQNRVRLAKEALKKTLNLPFDTEVSVVGKLGYEPRHFELDKLVETALQFRHEIKAAELEAKLRKINVTVEAADGRPDLRAFANYGGQTNAFGTSATDLLQGWNVGLRVTVPLFKGWAVKGRVEQARADYAKSLIGLEDQRKAVELQVRRAFLSLQDAEQTVLSQQENVGEAEQAVRDAAEREQAGDITEFEVRDTQLSLTEARTNLKQAQHAYNIALFELERAVGVPLAPLDKKE